MSKAERALGEARFLLQGNRSEVACSRAYYAMRDAAHAALIATSREAPNAMIKTHHGLIAAFGKILVQDGQLDAAFGRALNKVHDIRLLADYSGESPPLAEAEWAITQAEAFVAAVRGLMVQLKT